MKCILSKKATMVLMVFVCAVVFAGCGEKTIYGEVTDVKTDAQTGVFSFILTQDGGEPITVVTGEDTHILSRIEGVSESDLRDGAMEGIMVSVTGTTYRSSMNATEVQIDHLLIRDACTVADGTQIDILIGSINTFYCLEDGTELLMVRNTIGPDNVYSGTVESLNALSQEAQQKIKDYFNAQGILYDLFATLEDAYDAYCILKDDYSTYVLSQEMVPTASSDEIIYFLTIVSTPDSGTNGHRELRLGAAFHKDTGEVIPALDLFTCESDAIIDRFAEICKVDDEALISEMKVNFKPEYVIFFPDNLEITFPADALPKYGASHGMGFEYNAEVSALLQPWAIPNGSGIQ